MTPRTPDVTTLALTWTPRTPDARSRPALPLTPRTPDARLRPALPLTPRTPDARSRPALPLTPRTPDAPQCRASAAATLPRQQTLPRKPPTVLFSTHAAPVTTSRP